MKLNLGVVHYCVDVRATFVQQYNRSKASNKRHFDVFRILTFSKSFSLYQLIRIEHTYVTYHMFVRLLVIHIDNSVDVPEFLSVPDVVEY